MGHQLWLCYEQNVEGIHMVVDVFCFLIIIIIIVNNNNLILII